MRASFLVAVLSLFAGSAAAHADTLQLFNFAGNLDNNTGTGGNVSGTITFDITNGTYASSNLSSTYGSQTYAVSTVETTYATTYGSLVLLSFGSAAQPQDAVVSLVLPVTTLVGYQGSSICGDLAPCHEANNSNYTSGYFAPGSTFGDQFTAGALTLPPAPTPSSVTPEPSSMALLGTGMLGVAGVAKRRLA